MTDETTPPPAPPAPPPSEERIPVSLEDEMRKSYLDYAMSVIVGRALPDVRDGLKPVHRRGLYALRGFGNDFNKKDKKRAHGVVDVLCQDHPHSDASDYHTIDVRAQP